MRRTISTMSLVLATAVASCSPGFPSTTDPVVAAKSADGLSLFYYDQSGDFEGAEDLALLLGGLPAPINLVRDSERDWTLYLSRAELEQVYAAQGQAPSYQGTLRATFVGKGGEEILRKVTAKVQLSREEARAGAVHGSRYGSLDVIHQGL